MRKTIASVGTLLLSLTAAGTALAQSSTAAWIHVRVEEAAKQTKVNVNLPLAVIESVLKAAPEGTQPPSAPPAPAVTPAAAQPSAGQPATGRGVAAIMPRQ